MKKRIIYTVKRRAGVSACLVLAISITMIGFLGPVSGSASAQSLQEALALAYRTNPELRAEQADFEASAEQGALARAAGRPKIGGQLGYEFQDGDYDPGPVDLSGAGIGDLGPILGALTGNAGFGTTSAGIQITQPIFQGFRVRNSIKQADAAVKAAQSGLTGTEQRILAEVISAYLAVTTAEEAERVAGQSFTVLSEQLAAAEAAWNVGHATKLDTARLQAALERARAAQITAQGDLLVARAAFERLVGQAPASLEADPALPSLPANAEELMVNALDHNPQLKAAMLSEESALRAVKVAAGALAPSLSATAGYSEALDSFIQGDHTKSATLGIKLEIPFYQGGGEYAGLRQAKARHRAASQRRIATERQVREGVQAAWARRHAAAANLVAAERAVAAAEMALASARAENELGQRSNLDVLVAEEALFNARLQYVSARQQAQLTAYGLMQVSGQLTAQGLGLDTPYFDSEAARKGATRRWFGLE